MSNASAELGLCNPSRPKRHSENREGGKEDDGQDCNAGYNAKKKRKSNGTVTPRKRGSKSITPKKKVSANGIKGTASPDSTQKIDLWLEAKLSAEENSRIFAGRQIHPFFSSWKLGKKSQEPANTEPSLCTAKRGDGRIMCGPIHVFENCQDDASSLDWSNWTFLSKTATVDCSTESSYFSVSEGSVEPLSFDKLLSVPDPSCALISKITLSCSDHQLSVLPDNLQEISLANSTVLADEQTLCTPTPEDSKMVDEVGTFSRQAGCFRKLDTEPMSRFLQGSMRSYYHSCEDKAEGSLWTHKYKPTKALQVCGNDKSVNFLSDWLHLWRQSRQSQKDSSNMGQSGMPDNDDDYNDSDGDYEVEDINDNKSMQNILLITGPVGSGKSAAVYACAQEQGFDVLELNASDWRNGTAVKQYIGDALRSHECKSLLEHAVSSQKRTVKLPSAPALTNDKAAKEMGDGVTEVITISDDESESSDATPPGLHGKNTVFMCDNAQTLILVEDVDILFPEDRGCIAAIRQIAEMAKGPIILTSNSNNAGLPDSFDRLDVSFSLPSPHELFCHLYLVCVTEEVNINPLLLERFIQSCNGDIRQTTMQLQFWFQSKKYTKDQKVHRVYGSLPFDLEASHQIVPKIIPWSFPSELSKLIEKEVSKSVTIVEEKSCLPGLVNKELHTNERKNDLDVHYLGTDVEATKRGMIKRDRFIASCNEFESQHNAIYEPSTSGSPGVSSWQNAQRKPLVVSGDSLDEDPNGNLRNGHVQAYKGQSHEGNIESPCEFQLNQSYTGMSSCMPVCSGMDVSNKQQCKYLETADDTCLNETCKSLYTSCVPELVYVPETATDNGMETIFGAVSSGHLADPAEVSLNNGFTPFTLNDHQSLPNFLQNSEPLVNTRIPESSPKANVQYFRDENMESTTVHNVTDESIYDDLKLNSKLVDSNPSLETDTVQSLWTKLGDCRMDLKQHASSEHLGTVQVLKLASGLSNLLSEADLLFRNHQQKQCGIMEHPIFLSDEATFSWYDEQMMMSTVAVHGFCFYAKHLSDVGSTLGCETNSIDLGSEMLAPTTDIMALGKLSRQEQTKNVNIYTKNQLELNKPRYDKTSENRNSLFNVIQSILPARLSLALKGIAFNEYLSSLRQISISEFDRISKGVEKKRGRRARSAQHYLSRGAMMLSPEDISLVCEGDLYRKISSQYTANVESSHT